MKAAYRVALLLLALALAGQGQDSHLPATVGANRHLYEQAWTLYLQGNYDQALALAQRGLEEDKQAGRGAGIAEALNLIGTVHYKRGEYDQALGFYRQAAQAAERSHYRFGLGRDWSSLGSTYYRQGQYRQAKDYYQRSLAVRQAMGNAGETARALNDLANVYQQLGDYTQALALRRRALRLWRRRADPVGVADALNDIAWTYEDMGRYPQALRTLRSLTQYARLHHRWGMADTLESIGRVESKMGSHTDAVRDLEEADRQFTSLGARDEMARTASDLADAYLAMARPQTAVAQYQRALRLELAVNDRPVEGSTLAGLMLAWKAQRNLALAAFYGKQAVNLFQEIRGDVRAFDPSLGRSFLRTKEKTYRDLAEVLIAQGRLPEAEQVLNMLKEEEYFNFIQRDAGAAAALNGRAALTAKEAQDEQRYREISGRLAALGQEYGSLLEKKSRTPEEEQRLAQLESDLALAGAAFDKFLDGLAADFSTGGEAQARVFQVRELQGLMEDLRELGPGTVVLYTIVGPDKYRVILVTPNTELEREFPISAAELAAKVLALRRAMQDPGIDPRPLAQELYRVIAGPVAADLEQARAHTLLWSLDGVLRYLPLDALYDGRQYLVESYANVLITPASYARLKDQPRSHPTGLGLGVSKAYSGFQALPAVPEELDGIIESPAQGGKGVLPGTILLDSAFTADSLKQQLRRHYAVVHVASHFLLSPGDDADSFLLLGDGSHLALSDIEHGSNLFGGVDLLTLSACNTMVGAAGGDGREVEGFGIVAQRQGAKAVLATLWPVADESTQMLMREFYRQLESQPGLSKAEALRRAQIELLHGSLVPPGPAPRRCKGCSARGMAAAPGHAGGPGLPDFEPDPRAPFSHPYFWAPFVLIGNSR